MIRRDIASNYYNCIGILSISKNGRKYVELLGS